MSENIAEVIEKFDFQAIGEQNPKIKQVRGIISNSKPNPHKLFAAEGIWLLGMCEKFGTPVDSLILCPEHIRTPEAASLAEKIAARANELYTVSAKTFEKISERDRPDGLFALARLPKHDIAEFRPADDAVILILDGVEIPGNVGTMMRMADGAGGAWTRCFCATERRGSHTPSSSKGARARCSPSPSSSLTRWKPAARGSQQTA